MVEKLHRRSGNEASSAPLPPRCPLPLLQRVRAVREYHTGQIPVRDAGGPVTAAMWGPGAPMVVFATSPAAIHDVLGRSDAFIEKGIVHREMRWLMGDNLFDLPHDPWLPRRRAVQPLFTKRHVRGFAGEMVGAADAVTGQWRDGTVVDLDAQCRRLTLRALSRSILGLDIDDRADRIGENMRIANGYVADRALRPVRAPRSVPTPARARARAAVASTLGLAAEVVAASRNNPDGAAPLVRALMETTDPQTGRGLTDEEICAELLVFIGAGYDTTATTLAYTLWELGRNPDVQDAVRAEVDALGGRSPTPDDVPALTFTVQVLHEALRLCPPAPALGREAVQEVLVGGFRIPRGTILIAGTYAVHRDPDLWDDPLVFAPDRFRPDRMRSLDRWQYLPFGAGPRSCVGDHFAMLEATLALAGIVRTVAVESVRPDFPTAVPFTMVAAAPVPARVRRRAA